MTHRADVVYQRSMAVYQDGAVDAARRFAIEALAEDPNHLGARALLEKIDPSSWRATSAYLESTSVAVDETAISSEAYDEKTVLRSRAQPAVGAGEPFWRRLYARRDQWRHQRLFWPAAGAAGLVVVGLLGIAIYQLLGGPAGYELRITKPTGGSILSRGVSCGTIGSDCMVTRPDGEAVELQAQPDEGFLFAGYTGDCAAGGRTIMSEARTCGARFDPIPPPPPAALLALTIQPPKGGTIHAMGGIHCGTQDSQCTASFQQGAEVKLDVLADAGYAFARYTGSCAPDGATVMTEPRTCGALFTRSVTEVKPSPPPLSASRAPTPVPEPRRPLEPPPPPINAGGESNPPEGVGGDRPDKNPVERGPLSGATPTVIAKDAVRKTLNIFRDGHTRMLEDEIRRVYPGVPPSIRQQFRQSTSRSNTSSPASRNIRN